jgi:hypothetical protein
LPITDVAVDTVVTVKIEIIAQPFIKRIGACIAEE